MATGNLPLCFKKQTSVVKFPWPFRGSCLVKKNTHTHTHRHSIRHGLVVAYGAFAIAYSSLVTLLWLIHRDSRNLRESTRRRPC